MRVLHVLHTSLPNVSGYSLRSNQIVSLQRRAGVDVAVATSVQQPDAAVDELIDGVHYFRAPVQIAGRSPLREWRMMTALHANVQRAYDAFRPHIIHAHSPVLVGLPSQKVARRAGVPFVYEVRDLWENASVDRGKFAAESIAYRVARALETHVLRRADAVFTIGETLRAQLEPRARQAVTITPNGADTDAFAPTLPDAAWQQRWNPGGGPLISYIGSFQPNEGLDVLIRALPAIVARIADVRVLIVGDGPERANLQRLSDTLGVAPQVRFVGRVPHAQVREIYAVADLLVYPRLDTLTTRLTTPLKPLEALAMEKAVLASDLAAMRELVTHGETGCLFEPGNPAALARAAVELLQDAPRRLRLGKQGRLVTVAERTWQQSVAQYLPVYQKLLA